MGGLCLPPVAPLKGCPRGGAQRGGNLHVQKMKFPIALLTFLAGLTVRILFVLHGVRNFHFLLYLGGVPVPTPPLGWQGHLICVSLFNL